MVKTETMKNNDSQDSHINEQHMPEKVSIIMPTYKRALDFFSRALNSLLKQTYPNIEIVVVDDSPAGEPIRREIAEYMGKVRAEHSNVIYYQNEKNIGGALARNKGIDLASGFYITFLDDDDEYEPDKVKKQVAFMQEQDCDLSFSNLIMYNNAGEIVDMREFHDIPSFDNETLLHYHLMHHMTGTPTFMFKADKLREIGGFDDAKMGQEFYLMLKSIERGLKIRYFDDCDVIVYKHDREAISRGMNKINGENHLYAFKQKYFPQLNRKEIRFIRFRHYAVLVVAYLRNKMHWQAVKAGFKAFISSPGDFFREVSGFLIKVFKLRQNSKKTNAKE